MAEALFWGLFSSSALYIGEALARRLATRPRATGLAMGFGAGTLLSAVAYSDRRIFRMWIALTIACGVVAALGFALGDALGHEGLYAEAFAAGAVLTMLADSMMPKAFEHGGKTVGLVTVVGYLVAAALAVAD